MENDSANLVERVERLERVVEGLLARDPKAAAALAAAARHVDPHGATPRGETPAAAAPAAASAATRSPDLRTWLRVIGIALLLFGVAFLFKYSQDESDLLRSVRVAIGIVLGIGLAVVGRALLARDRPFAQILTGGGIAVWYMSGFAAYQLFDLIPALPGFLYMAVVTLAAFAISLRQNSAPLAVVATVGGLATPFLLHAAERGVGGVVLYVALVASTAVAIHLKRRWWMLLGVAAAGSAFAVTATIEYHLHAETPDVERWLLQGGLLFLFALFAVSVAVSYARGARAGESGPRHDDRLFFVTLVPVAMVFLTHGIWTLTQDHIGQFCVGLAVLYGGATYVTYRREELRRLANAHFLVATGMAACGALALIDGELQHLAIATEALVLRLMCRRTRVSIADGVSHALFLIAGVLVLRDLTTNPSPDLPLFNRTGITTLWSIAAAATATFWLPRAPAGLRRAYFYAAHALVLAWILHQFKDVHNGQALVTILWGVYGAGLMVAGLRRTIRSMRTVGLLTLLAVVVKLFLVDLVSVPAIWRVLLFIGFGGVFLALSYWFLTLDRGAKRAD